MALLKLKFLTLIFLIHSCYSMNSIFLRHAVPLKGKTYLRSEISLYKVDTGSDTILPADEFQLKYRIKSADFNDEEKILSENNFNLSKFNNIDTIEYVATKLPTQLSEIRRLILLTDLSSANTSITDTRAFDISDMIRDQTSLSYTIHLDKTTALKIVIVKENEKYIAHTKRDITNWPKCTVTHTSASCCQKITIRFFHMDGNFCFNASMSKRNLSIDARLYYGSIVLLDENISLKNLSVPLCVLSNYIRKIGSVCLYINIENLDELDATTQFCTKLDIKIGRMTLIQHSFGCFHFHYEEKTSSPPLLSTDLPESINETKNSNLSTTPSYLAYRVD